MTLKKIIDRLFSSSDRRTEQRRIGDRGEDLAAKHLKRNGYRILWRNYTFHDKEIDIIARKKDTVAFVEVKTTTSDRAEEMKAPMQAVDRDKRHNLTVCAESYIRRHGGERDIYRFDIIEVYFNRDTPEINHIENAFYAEKGYKRQWK